MDIGEFNPIRYRGYYYDTETGYYWLQTRYYNPQWRRFINADVLFIAGNPLTAANMYAYCNGNPVMRVDPTGMNAVVRAAWDLAFRGPLLAQEIAAINAHPVEASMALVFAAMAMGSALRVMGGGTDDRDGTNGNAYMHAYWSFMMAVFLGADLAFLFSAAHEGQDPAIYNRLTHTTNSKGEITSISYGLSDKNAEMDLFNNFIGIVAGITYNIVYPHSIYYPILRTFQEQMDFAGAIAKKYLYWIKE